MRTFSIAIIALWMLSGGIAHMIWPQAFYRIVPDFLPELWVVYISGIVEIVIGLAVLVPSHRKWAGLSFAVLCAGFLPLHIWDFFRLDPVFDVPVAASIRIAVQFGLIGLGLFLWRCSSNEKRSS